MNNSTSWDIIDNSREKVIGKIGTVIDKSWTVVGGVNG